MNLSFGTEVIYEDAEFMINEGDKVGVVGVNGSGKTTLFRVILKEQELDSGRIAMGKPRIGYLPQEIALDDQEATVWDYLYDGRPIRRLEQELEGIYEALAAGSGDQPALLKRMARIQELLEAQDCYEAESILLGMIDNMRIDADLLDAQVKRLSGGQKSKVAFARVLFSNPEILLLDEPTNHLDKSTRAYVSQSLKNYKGMVLIISHDVDFLHGIIDKVLYINKVNHKIRVYDGDYHTYQRKLAQEKRMQDLRIAQQEREIKALTDVVKRAKEASRTNHHLKRLGQERAARLEKRYRELEARDRVYRRVKMDIKPERQGGKMPLMVEELAFGYPGQKRLYEKLSFALSGEERFLVVGENGVGKSTLLKLLVGELTPERGRVRYDPKTDWAYYAQELELLDPDKRILDNVETPGFTEQKLRTVLGNFLFTGDDVFKRVSVLSPGEKARISLCKILLKRANLLLLDEPTNHLDPETQAVIGSNFNQYPGTIIVVSHNPAFVEQIGINRMLILPSGSIRPYSRELLKHYYDVNSKEENK